MDIVCSISEMFAWSISSSCNKNYHNGSILDDLWNELAVKVNHCDSLTYANVSASILVLFIKEYVIHSKYVIRID